MIDMENLIRLMSRNTIKLSIPGENCPEVGRFGGLPDVPPGFVWPYFETDTYEDKEVKPHPLSFIAQFDCAALANMDTEGLLPHEGILSFFYEMESQCWGFDPKNAGCAKVYWFPDKSVLAPASFPEDLQDYNRFPDFPIRGSRQISYPDYSDAFPNGYDPENPDNYEEYEKVFAGLAGKGEGEPFHKLLGWPNIIQNNMTQQCELVSRGHYCGGRRDNIPEEDRRAAEEISKEDWRLLFQLDSFGEGDFSLDFGDCGSIYFYIRIEDLKARRFDRVWLILQCY